MGNNYVWYACYGSNINLQRFLCYIKGGECTYNGKIYSGCTNKSLPVREMPKKIPYQLYFGNSSMSWGGSAVAFIVPRFNPFACTLGRMYLITEEQFEEIHMQEGKSHDWYGQVIEFGEKDGYKIKTFTNAGIRPVNAPGKGYLKAMFEGIKETYTKMSNIDIEYYLECMHLPPMIAQTN